MKVSVSSSPDPTTGPAVQQSARDHLPQLDGLRGIAILLVLLTHSGAILRDLSWTKVFAVGWTGVDLFFVLSGFLITRILLSTRGNVSYYRRFYIRRGLRIWPVYYLYLALIVLASLGVHARESEFFQFVTPRPLYLLFLQNLYWPSLFCFRDVAAVTWSLCIEEHFYLAWPLLVRHVTVRGLRTILIAVLALSPALRIATAYLLRHQTYSVFYQTATRFTPLHLDSIAAGCLLSILCYGDSQMRQSARYHRLLIPAGGALAAFTFSSENPYLFALCFTGLAAFFTGILSLALSNRRHPILANPALRYTGKISYGLYLIHPTVFLAFQSHTLFRRFGLTAHIHATEVIAALLAVSLSFILAAMSWRFFERPILARKDTLAPYTA